MTGALHGDGPTYAATGAGGDDARDALCDVCADDVHDGDGRASYGYVAAYDVSADVLRGEHVASLLNVDPEQVCAAIMMVFLIDRNYYRVLLAWDQDRQIRRGHNHIPALEFRLVEGHRDRIGLG